MSQHFSIRIISDLPLPRSNQPCLNQFYPDQHNPKQPFYNISTFLHTDILKMCNTRRVKHKCGHVGRILNVEHCPFYEENEILNAGDDLEYNEMIEKISMPHLLCDAVKSEEYQHSQYDCRACHRKSRKSRMKKEEIMKGSDQAKEQTTQPNTASKVEKKTAKKTRNRAHWKHLQTMKKIAKLCKELSINA